MYSLLLLYIIVYGCAPESHFQCHRRLTVSHRRLTNFGMGWAIIMAYDSSLPKQAGANPTVNNLGRMIQSSLQSKVPDLSTPLSIGGGGGGGGGGVIPIDWSEQRTQWPCRPFSPLLDALYFTINQMSNRHGVERKKAILI